jgi:lipopolysaccharide/colanic/teichoic acid biosynthesis glycosyltransferase
MSINLTFHKTAIDRQSHKIGYRFRENDVPRARAALCAATSTVGKGNGGGARIKRIIDCVGATVALLLLFPVMLLIAVLIRLDSRGPILFRQERIGRGGRTFWIFKFRTMIADAEDRLPDLEPHNESAGGVLFKMRRDPRITLLGSLLRRTSLDELPQLFNVLRGEMSLVGPRPLQLRDCTLLQRSDPAGYHKRHQVLPGITGLWQVSGRSDLDFERMLNLDHRYIDDSSLVMDLWIIVQTIKVLLTCKGAY